MKSRQPHHPPANFASQTIALQPVARYIVRMNSRSPSINFSKARLIAILSLGLLLRAART